jgi:ribosome-associated heat shock protein Hsp15
LAGPSGKPDPAAAQKLRLDKWLWQARFFKSRTLAAEVIAEGHVRVNDVMEGDTLTFPLGNRIRVIRILARGQRRGPATEAQALYLDLEPSAAPDPSDSLE